MPITWNEEKKLFNVTTKNATYQMKVDSYNHLIHTYYGSQIDDTDMYTQISFADRGFSANPYEAGKMDRTYSLDVLPQEYSCYGTGDFRITGLRVKESTGNQTVALKYVKHAFFDGFHKINGLPSVHGTSPSTSLCITMKDDVNGLVVELWYGILEETDVITRTVKLINRGNAQLIIEKAASMNLDFTYGEFDWITLHGRHAMERNVERRAISHGISSIGSVRGTSSHHYNPFTILCEKETTETNGSCYGFSFMYSGEFLIEVEKDQMAQTRMIMGIHPDNFSWILDPDQTLELPMVIMSYSANGLGKLSQNYHKTIKENVIRGNWKNKRRPVLINNWEATYFDFTGDKLVEIAKEAQSLGIELFVLDDGWFGKRDDDNSGLGDWYPNEKKLGCTLKELGNRIVEQNILFGLWLEPEAINEDSDLYRAHPDWVIKAPGRMPALGRNQLLLDFSRDDVCDYIIEVISQLLTEVPISYIKWDMNRSMCDKFSNNLDAAHQGEFAHRFILGLYHVLETLTTRFPDVLFEGCSGGGGRYDCGMLYYTPQIWLSDNTDAINRLSIQYGSSLGYPVATMGAHVSAIPNHQTGRSTSLSTRGTVAMAGTFGYELDVTKLTEEEKVEVKKQIKTFQKYYDLIQNGVYYRLTSADDICTVWEIVAENKSEALISAVYHGVEANPIPIYVKIQGLDEKKQYEISYLNADCTKQIMSGIALKNAGINIKGATTEFESYQIYIREI
ncbi:MAG: alpha-galactosidase [Lachnospiraceae bacterium]|nr:alpha-galactosidase [Lachnospiraceae bacterium]